MANMKKQSGILKRIRPNNAVAEMFGQLRSHLHALQFRLVIHSSGIQKVCPHAIISPTLPRLNYFLLI
jgi:hypothetical protein